MAAKKKGTFASAQNALIKALRNMEKTVADLVPAVGARKTKSKTRRTKKRRNKSRGR